MATTTMNSGIFSLALLTGFLVVTGSLPMRAASGNLLEMKGRVTAADPQSKTVTVLDSRTAGLVKVHMGRDAFEPGQSWRNLNQSQRVKVMATYNFDGSVQARRVQLQ